MSKIKEVSSFNGSTWGTAVPLGANDSNVDITSSTTNAADSTATLAGLDDTNVTVASGDTDASAWTKFNKFRKRVKNVFGNYVTTSLVANAYKASPSSGEVYSAGVLNNYMANVIGISGTSTATVAGSEQTVLSAINSLNDKTALISIASSLVSISDATGATWSISDIYSFGYIIIFNCTIAFNGSKFETTNHVFWSDAIISIPNRTIIEGFGFASVSPGIGIVTKLVGSSSLRVRFYDISHSYTSTNLPTILCHCLCLTDFSN